MLSQTYFYNFETKKVPGKIIAHGIRFETIEIPAQGFNETEFKILCEEHPELKQFTLAGLKDAIAKNFPSLPR